MNKLKNIVLFLALIPLLASGLGDYFQDVDALKSKGTPNHSSTEICGLDLCSAVGLDKPQPPQGQIITPENDDPENLDSSVELLFVQTANSGTFVQKDGRNILTLVEISPTVWFSDRPHRITGQEATDLFAAKWAEGKNSFAINPPNAALNILDGTENSDVIIVELSNPIYSPESETLQYDVIILEEATEGLTHYSKDADATIPSVFTKVALFIDDSDGDSESGAIPIPGISQFYGVDITRGMSSSNLVPLALFDFDADNTIEVKIGDNNYLVPESLVLDSTDNYDMESHVYTSIKELSNSLSVSAGISYSSPEVDAEVDAQYSQDSSSSESSYFATVDAYDRKYRLTAATGLDATEKFQKAVEKLPSQYVGNQDDYFNFFSTFGTHYTNYVEYGGIMHYWSQESDTSSMSAEEFEVSVSATVNVMTGSASADVDVSGSSSESESSSNINVSVIGSGGDGSLLGAYLTQRSPESFNDWWASIDDDPGQMNIKYNEIYNLVTDSHKKAQIQNAMSDYLRAGFGYQILVTNENGHFSSTISIGTSNADTATFNFPTDKALAKSNGLVPFGGMMVVSSLQTGEIIEIVTVNEFPEDPHIGTNIHFSDATISILSDKIQHYENQGDRYLYFISMVTKFDTGDQSDFLWLQKIGAESFVDIPHSDDYNFYVLVGHSDLGERLGQSMIHNTLDVFDLKSKGVSNPLEETARNSAYMAAKNGLPDLNCEFSGGITKTTEGFTTINTPTTNQCS